MKFEKLSAAHLRQARDRLDSAKTGSQYNVGAGRTIPLNEMIWTMVEIIGKKARVRKRGVALGDLRNTSADIKRISRDLGYWPRTGLEEGLRAQVSHQLGPMA